MGRGKIIAAVTSITAKKPFFHFIIIVVASYILRSLQQPLAMYSL